MLNQSVLLHFLELCLYNDACNHAKIYQFCYIFLNCVSVMMLVNMKKSISSSTLLWNVLYNDACSQAKINQFCYIYHFNIYKLGWLQKLTTEVVLVVL